MAQPTRCGWAGPEPIYLDYHDHEWGRPTHDDRALFELLSLEGMQAGLSWITILKKREAFRAAFADFEPAAVARFDEAKVAELMQNAGIVRNRRKIVSVIENARHFLEVQREFGSFDRFLWAYVDGKPIVNSPETDADVPASTPLSDRISRDLKKRGFTFVGTTIVYSLLQSAGLVDDHLKGCSWHASCRPPEYRETEESSASFPLSVLKDARRRLIFSSARHTNQKYFQEVSHVYRSNVPNQRLLHGPHARL